MRKKSKVKNKKAKVQKKAYSFLFFLSSILCLLFSIFYPLPSICYSQQQVSSTDLIERAKELDGQEVVYQGEAIGEVMLRGAYGWVNFNDGVNAIGVWLPRDLAKTIGYAGSFRAYGDWVEVRGRFSRACRMHGGDLDIHALSLIKIKTGREIKDRLVLGKKRIVVVLTGALLCILTLQLFRPRPKKK